MALAEARAAWQRTANRCLVQEDAKRAPKLACCSSSVPPSVKQAETGPTGAAAGQDIPNPTSLPFNHNPSYSNLSPNSRWWLQLQPNYGYQKGLMDEQLTSTEGKLETCQIQESSGDVARNVVDQTSHVESYFDNQFSKKEFSVEDGKFATFCSRDCQDPLKLEAKEDFRELRGEDLFCCEVSKNANYLYLDSESSWIGAEKNTPWWRTADTEELALLVAQRSLDLIENCDLPRPQNTHFRKDLRINISCNSNDQISTSPLDRKPGIGSHNHCGAHDSNPVSLTAGSSCRQLRMSARDQLVSVAGKPLSVVTCDRKIRGIASNEGIPEMPALEDDASKARLLEALRHSQTRAREAEHVAKQACAEKDHVVKLVFRQASQLFAYKQWLQLLQLENMYFQFKNAKAQTSSAVFPVMLPWTPLRNRKMRKSWQKSSSRKRARRPRPQIHDVGRYAVAFALGLGLVGAGLLLGWTIGWLLPTW
ncbi:UNVERIFIED_CONTAM: hypothetical protein Sradi_3299400 [Sesamum radiatum]|uniref:Uncharacterized protein n=1 Tax=Sesamum radiatum TaxID=300843 RepID=A0AAW2R185_SESRA